MSAGLVLLSSGMAEILECAVEEEESLSRGQRFVFLGLGLSLGALGFARTMHHRDWDELDKAVKADLDLGKWFQKKNKKGAKITKNNIKNYLCILRCILFNCCIPI